MQFLAQGVSGRVDWIGQNGLTLPCPSPRGALSGILGRTECNPVQPACQALAADYGCSFACQNQKGCLKSILGIVGVIQYTPADSHNHGAVAIDQDRERQLSGLIPATDELVEQTTIVEVPYRTETKEGSQVLDGFLRCSALHQPLPRSSRRLCYSGGRVWSASIFFFESRQNEHRQTHAMAACNAS
jgi:hypothetical protein